MNLVQGLLSSEKYRAFFKKDEWDNIRISSEIREKALEVRAQVKAKHEARPTKKFDPYRTPRELYAFLKDFETFEHRVECRLNGDTLVLSDVESGNRVDVTEDNFRGSITRSEVVRDSRGNAVPVVTVSVYLGEKGKHYSRPEYIPRVDVRLVR